MKAEAVILSMLIVSIALTLSACTPQDIAETDIHTKDVLITYTTQQQEPPQMIETFSTAEKTEIINPYFSVQNSTGEIFRVDHGGNFYLYPLTTCGKLYTDGAGLVTCGTDADTDTNASTACSGAEVLYGNGTCAEVPSLEVTYYNATSIQVITGTGAGALADIQTYNQVTYNVTEASSDYDLRVNFTGITEFTTLLVRHKSDEAEGHIAAIQIWDYDSSNWEGYGYLTEALTSEIKTLGVYDDSDHIQDGVVQVRFYQDEPATPPTTHIHQFDWVSLSKGFGTPVGQEVDPYAVHTDGTTELTADWNVGAYIITANEFIGNISCANITGATSDLCTLVDTDTDTNLTDADILTFGYNHTTDLTTYYNGLYADISVVDTDTTYTNASFDLSQLANTDDIDIGDHNLTVGTTLFINSLINTIAMGGFTSATGDYSIAMGYSTTASGSKSTAIGRGIEAGGESSIAIGLNDQSGVNVTQANTMAIMGGKVGIGTISPAQVLDVVGNINTTGNITTEAIILENDQANHKIYDNETCIIMKAGTTYLEVCE